MPADPTLNAPPHPVRRWLPLLRAVRNAWPTPDERPPLSLWAALIEAESSGRADAISPAGAVGLGQVMPSDYAAYTPALRAMFRDRPTTAALLDPRTNLEWSLRILITLGYRRCATWDRALMAYFTGRCDAPAARDITGVTGADYMRRILRLQDQYRDLDAPAEPPPADVATLEARLARLERRVSEAAAALSSMPSNNL